MTRAACIAIVAALAGGCGGGGTFVALTIDRSGGAVDVASIDLALTLDGAPASATLREPGGAAIAFPTSVTLSIGKGQGTLSIIAVARDASGTEVARDSSSTLVSVGATSRLGLDLRGTLANDLGSSGDLEPSLSSDLAPPPDLGPPPDLTPPRDLTPPPDLTTPVPPDLSLLEVPSGGAPMLSFPTGKQVRHTAQRA